MTFLFLAAATVLHCLQSYHERLGISDFQVFWAWVIAWIVANLAFLRHAINVRNREVDLVKQLGWLQATIVGRSQVRPQISFYGTMNK
eukprot:COSAG02_NODE_897_length_16123_cov_10.462993_2_plen_88_part_00